MSTRQYLQGFDDGRLLEQERIIKLFTNPCTCEPETWQCECGGENQINVIAIIKGESK